MSGSRRQGRGRGRRRDHAEAHLNRQKMAAEGHRSAHKVKRRSFHYPGGLVDFVKHINRTKQAIHNSVVDFSGRARGHEVEVAMPVERGLFPS